MREARQNFRSNLDWSERDGERGQSRNERDMPPQAHFKLTVPPGPADHSTGAWDAKVVVVEYADFGSPICAQANSVMKLLLRTHGQRMRYVFRHFPLRDVHPQAELAAEAAEAASGQGQFWQMADLLFENQGHLKEKFLRQYAGRLGLDLQRFDAELADHIYLQRVQEHIAGGLASGVRESPGFFVNGQVLDISFGMDRLFELVESHVKRNPERGR